MDDSLRLTHDKEDTVYRNGYVVLYRVANDKRLYYYEVFYISCEDRGILHIRYSHNATEKVCYIFKPGVLFGFLYRNTGN